MQCKPEQTGTYLLKFYYNHCIYLLNIDAYSATARTEATYLVYDLMDLVCSGFLRYASSAFGGKSALKSLGMGNKRLGNVYNPLETYD